MAVLTSARHDRVRESPQSPESAAVHRYAIYAAVDPESLLHNLASAWLGRDAARGVGLPRPRLDGIDDTAAAAWTAEPARYGFHATLKPPFRLADGRSSHALDDTLRRFAAVRTPVTLGRLEVTELSGFVALRPAAPAPALRALVDDVVRTFDAFRRPPDETELRRRRAASLTPRQEANLVTWGYPYVMDDFRLHFTLTGRLSDDARARAVPALTDYLAPALAQPLAIAALWLFVEPSPGAPFRQAGRYALAASGGAAA
jgi:putative phosphonate metabolism protein